MDHHSKPDHTILKRDGYMRNTAPSGPFHALQSSLTAKIFLICFFSIHLPLLAMVTHVFIHGLNTTTNMLILLLLATLAGTIVCFYTVWWLIRPLRRLSASIEHYREEGVLLPTDPTSRDEIGIVSRAISSLVTDMDEMVRALRFDANTDVLTGLANRRLMLARGPQELAKAVESQDPLTLLVFDLDHFKVINDTFGHETGDKVLMAVAHTVRSSLRPLDLAARIGGEEFCVLLPKTTLQQAQAIAERLRNSIESLHIEPLPKGGITASFGLAQNHGKNPHFHGLMVNADTALYSAKKHGRNCIKLYQS